MTDELKLKVIDLIERALEGWVDATEASKFLSDMDPSDDQDLLDAAHSVVHLLTDEDIRAKYPEHDEWYRADLIKMKASLESKKRGKLGG